MLFQLIFEDVCFKPNFQWEEESNLKIDPCLRVMCVITEAQQTSSGTLWMVFYIQHPQDKHPLLLQWSLDSGSG